MQKWALANGPTHPFSYQEWTPTSAPTSLTGSFQQIRFVRKLGMNPTKGGGSVITKFRQLSGSIVLLLEKTAETSNTNLRVLLLIHRLIGA